jgi:hypothetical protein
MKHSLVKLLPDEFESLMEALRRDIRSELGKSVSDPAWADWHRSNARKAVRILEAINPKRQVLHQLKEMNTLNKTDQFNVPRSACLIHKEKLP